MGITTVLVTLLYNFIKIEPTFTKGRFAFYHKHISNRYFHWYVDEAQLFTTQFLRFKNL